MQIVIIILVLAFIGWAYANWGAPQVPQPFRWILWVVYFIVVLIALLPVLGVSFGHIGKM